MKQQENRAEPQEKQIRFIDSHYNLKFYISDGGKIRITFRDGQTADRVCKYIDDYHLYVGNCCYPICEFAEKCKFIKVKQCERFCGFGCGSFSFPGLSRTGRESGFKHGIPFRYLS